MALLLGAPLAVAIALFLSMLAPAGVRGIISPLVEMLAAIPSVILGFWGILVLAPFVHEHLEPFLHNTLASSRSSAPRKRPAPASSRRA